jgi:hypothetical protein
MTVMCKGCVSSDVIDLVSSDILLAGLGEWSM